jgi:SAM-dependent methyltransferase
MRNVVYWPRRHRLVYLDAKATPQYWDSRWQAEGKPPAISARDDVVAVTATYLPRGSRILEGGCGRANKVKAMVDAGFCAVGLDFAPDAVKQARLHYPDLDIREGDVRSLEFPNGSLDGYWSIGVIEHFWEGYGSIIAEAARVLKPSGFLFLTAPWLSPYRKHKARVGGYPSADFSEEPDGFYQFALGREEVCGELAQRGFRVLRWRGRVSEISMRDDMALFQRQTQWLLASRGSLAKRIARLAIFRALNQFCGHSFLAVAQRSADSLCT